MKAEIHTAYSYSPKFRAYTVAAYVLESDHPGLPKSHTFKVLGNYAIDDTREAAEAEALARIREGNARHPADMPVIRHGRATHDRVTGYCF